MFTIQGQSITKLSQIRRDIEILLVSDIRKFRGLFVVPATNEMLFRSKRLDLEKESQKVAGNLNNSKMVAFKSTMKDSQQEMI